MTTFFPNSKPILKGKAFLLLAPLTLFFGLAMASPAQAQKLIIFDAPNSGQSAGQGTEASGINLEGTITGNVTDNNFGTHGFVRTPDGHFTNFDAPHADPIVGCTCPNGINDLGVIAGNTIDTNGVNHGFVRTPEGQFVIFDAQVPAVTGAGQGTVPEGINDFGVIAGTYTDGNNTNHGFVRTARGSITNFDVPQASQGTFPGNINNFGVIVGTFLDANFVSHGFIRTAEGKFKVFDAPGSVGGPIGTFSAFINDLGVIAGSYYDANTNVEHGYLRWPNGHVDQFAAPKAGNVAFTGTDVHAVNLEGTATGMIFNHTDSTGSQESHAFVRAANGEATTFNVPGQINVQNPGWFGSAGAAINAAGVVAGRFHDTNLVAHAYLRIP